MRVFFLDFKFFFANPAWDKEIGSQSLVTWPDLVRFVSCSFGLFENGLSSLQMSFPLPNSLLLFSFRKNPTSFSTRPRLSSSLLVDTKEPRQLRNNRKKPKKFSDGESSISPTGNEGKEITESGYDDGGKSVDAKKAAAPSRELSRLGDDVVIGKEVFSSGTIPIEYLSNLNIHECQALIFGMGPLLCSVELNE